MKYSQSSDDMRLLGCFSLARDPEVLLLLLFIKSKLGESSAAEVGVASPFKISPSIFSYESEMEERERCQIL